MSAGRLFHNRAPAVANVRSPTDVSVGCELENNIARFKALLIKIFREHDLISLLILFFSPDSLLGRPLQKSQVPTFYESDPDEIWQVVLQHASIETTSYVQDGAMTLYHAEKCRHLVGAHAASARRICSSVRQFLIHITFENVTAFRLSGILLASHYLSYWRE